MMVASHVLSLISGGEYPMGYSVGLVVVMQEQIKDIIIIEKTIAHPTLTRAWSEAGTEGR